VTQIGQDARPASGSKRPEPEQASGDTLVGRTGATASGRALVPTTPLPRDGDLCFRGRPSGAFLAQLIATALKVPQTRPRRRAAPQDASRAYAGAATGATATGRLVQRAM
jgi:hypothetical protein